MADNDIASLIANSGKTNADFNFGKIADAYWKGLESAYKQRTEDVFQDPSLYGPDGQLDPYKGVAAGLKAGGLPGAEATKNVAGIADLLSRFGNSADANRVLDPNAPRSPYERNPPNSPPSLQRPGVTPSQSTLSPDDNAPVASGDTIMKVVAANGIPNDQIGAVSDSIGATLGIHPQATINLSNPVFRKSLIDEITKVKKAGVGTVYPPGQATPAPQVLTPPGPQAQVTPPAPAPGTQTPIVPTPVQTQSITPQTAAAPQMMDPTLNGVITRAELARFGTPQNVLQFYQTALRRGLPPDQQKVFENKVEAIQKQLEYTGEKKNALESGFSSPLEADVAKANTTELGKQDIDTFQKRNIPIQAAAQMSYDGQDKAKLMKQLTLDPNFYSGPLSENVQTYNQFKSVFGQNPSAALPQEAFNKVTADMLTEQIKAMGNSGVGRVLMAEVNNMKKSLAGLGITATTNRALAEIVSRNYDKMQKIAEIANGVPQVPGQMNRELDKRVQAYLAKNPLFTPQELAHPALLGAPDAPPGAEKWNQAQGRAWGAKIGLKPGDPVRINGVIRNLQ